MEEPSKAEKAAAMEQVKDRVRWCRYSRRVALSTILGRSDRGVGVAGERVVVAGWVKSCRETGRVAEGEEEARPAAAAPPVVDLTCSEVLMSRVPFLRSITRILVGPLAEKIEAVARKPDRLPSVACLRINDGSCIDNIQIIVDSSIHPLSQVMPIGTSISVEGIIILKKPWTPGKHAIEIVAEKVIHIGSVDAGIYPLKRKRLSLDYLRLHPHLRPRATTIASICRIRNGLTHSTHDFFKSNGFIHVHMPIISSTFDGNLGRTFQVMSLSEKSHGMDDMSSANEDTVTIESVKAAISEKSKRIEELKRSNSNRDVLLSALDDLKNANELALRLEGRQKKRSGAGTRLVKFNSAHDFFSHPIYLCRTATLHLESHTCSLGNVYALSPVFQAEKKHTKKNLAEMWMLDVNLAFSELEDAMSCAEDFLKFTSSWILQNFPSDLKFLSERVDKDCTHRLESIKSSQFKKITYTEAIEALKKAHEMTSEFTRIEWGDSLTEEHERYLSENVCKCPVIIYDHPKSIKPFFMRLKDDQRTVSSFDIIVPKAGALIRGGQNEERLDIILERIQDLGLPKEQYNWYLDLRRHGTVKHSGFSLGLEHLVMFVTGIEDARDVIPFPRTFGNVNA